MISLIRTYFDQYLVYKIVIEKQVNFSIYFSVHHWMKEAGYLYMDHNSRQYVNIEHLHELDA
jgi:hypothetical protein